MPDFTAKYPTGSTLYMYAERISDKDDYTVVLSDAVTSGSYIGNMDASAPLGQYLIYIYVRTGDSPDPENDHLISWYTAIWSGSDFSLKNAIEAIIDDYLTTRLLMSNATEKTAIANIGLLSIGQKRISALDDGSPPANNVLAIFENVIRELLQEDWSFNRKRVPLSALTQVNKMTIDTAPTANAFYVGGTITGVTSNVTCKIIERLSDTVYLVTEPSGDFTDGEALTDDADTPNTMDCAAGYPQISEGLAYGSWNYGYVLPTDLMIIRRITDKDHDKVEYPYNREGKAVFTNVETAWLHYNKWLGEIGSLTTSDVTIMPSWFHQLASAKLAYILAPNITKDMRHRQKAEIEWKSAVLNAKEMNGKQSYHPDEKGNKDWANGMNRELGIG